MEVRRIKEINLTKSLSVERIAIKKRELATCSKLLPTRFILMSSYVLSGLHGVLFCVVIYFSKTNKR